VALHDRFKLGQAGKEALSFLLVLGPGRVVWVAERVANFAIAGEDTFGFAAAAAALAIRSTAQVVADLAGWADAFDHLVLQL